MRAGPRRAATVVLALALLLTSASFAVAAPADDPTWAEVTAARKDVRLQHQAVARIQKALRGLEADAAQLGDVALRRAKDARAARERLEEAEAAQHGLEDQAGAARTRAAASRRTAGAVATQLSRSGDPTLAVWLSGRGSGSLLYRLGALAQVGDASSALMHEARAAERQARALGEQTAAQAAVRDRLADRATAALNVARAAQARADAQVAATKDRRSTLLAQLGQLEERSESLAASYEAAQAAKRAAAKAGDGGGGGSLSGIAPGPDSLSPRGARQYAASRLGAYGWNGTQMSCLISLWNIESGWRWNALNASSGAYGIPQSLPGDKMAAAGGDWTTSAKTQIEWGLGYIKARYSTPCSAYRFETSHVPYWY